MFKQFLKEKFTHMIMIVSILLLFLIIFLLLQLPLEGCILGSVIVIFIDTIYLGIEWLNYQKYLSIFQMNEKLVDENQMLRDQRGQLFKDLESYFILWIHQIKTPITALFLLIHNMDADQKPAIYREIQQIDNYTQLALSYLKLIQPSQNLNIQHVEVDQLLAPLFKKYRNQFIHDRTKLHYQKIQSQVLTDANWAQIMIEQLLNNALKYAKGKDIWVEFDAEQGQLCIRDNGPGIITSDLPKIFDKGFSGFNGRLNEKSSGLGLYIAQYIGKHLNHPLLVESKLGQGSRFSIVFNNLSKL